MSGPVGNESTTSQERLNRAQAERDQACAELVLRHLQTPRRGGPVAVAAACPGPHFTSDPDLPPDPYTGVHVCVWCHLPGAAGDAHHRLPDAGEAQAVQRRRIGEDREETPDA